MNNGMIYVPIVDIKGSMHSPNDACMVFLS